MAKKSSTTMPLHAKSTPTERESADRAHKTELINSTLDMASYNAHGFAHGAQGRRGHPMVANDAAGAQKGGYIPQAMGKDGGGFDDDQRMADDYGKAGGDE